MTTLALSRTRAFSVWEQYVRGNGLTVTLAALVSFVVALPLQQAQWVGGMLSLVLVALLGNAAAYVFFRLGWTALRSTLAAAALGVGAVLVAGAVVASGRTPFVRIGAVAESVAEWTEAALSGGTHSGTIVFAMLLTLVVWTLGYLAVALAVRRAGGWPTVALGGVVLALGLVNLGAGAGVRLGAFMVVSALLIIHLNTVRRMIGWRLRRTSFDPQTVLAHSGIVLAFGLVITIAAAAAPSPSFAPLEGASAALDDVSVEVRRQFNRLFLGLPARGSYYTIAFEESTAFRGNPNLTDQLLFRVSGGPPTYWRGRVYTTYTSEGWDTVETDLIPFEEVPQIDVRGQTSATHEFKVAAATDTLFSGGLPAGFDEPAEAMVASGDPGDVLQVLFSEGREYYPTRVNLNYVSTGIETTAVPSQLRLAGEDYPEHVASTYLQLPETLPRRVRALAEAIASDRTNAYDTASSMRTYLQLRHPYNLDIAAPPEGQDGVDYFLFDVREGYCDYYASAMTVMLRVAGVPARYVVGYASGAYNPTRNAYEVRELHYHAWVEAYFPEYGWVPFEPTPPNAIEFGGAAGAPPILEDDIDTGELGEILEDEEEEDFYLPTVEQEASPWLPLLLAALVAAVVAGSAFWFWRWWWALGRLTRSEELFGKMSRLGSMLGMQPRPEQTGRRYAETLADELPECRADIETIAYAYELRRYGRGHVPLPLLADAQKAWGRLRWAMLRRFFRVRA